MMKCALVLLVAALFFCSIHTCAKSTDIQKRTLQKLSMRSNKKEGITAAPGGPDGGGGGGGRGGYGGGQGGGGGTPGKSPGITNANSNPTNKASQQSTGKPGALAKGKTDSIGGHVTSHVALFIGIIALLSFV